MKKIELMAWQGGQTGILLKKIFILL